MKNIIPVLAVIAAIVITVLLMRGCKNLRPEPLIKYDTVLHDTVITQVVIKPVPYEVLVNGKPRLVEVHDTTLIDTGHHYTPADTAAMLYDYLTTRKYRDTLRGIYGYVVLNNTVNQNKLTYQEGVFTYSVPEITKTVTKKERMLYGGFNAGFGTGIGMGGVQLLYLDRRDNIFHVKLDYSTMGTYGEAGVSFKINLPSFLK